MEEKLILANPAKKCKIPKNTRKEMNILPEALIGPYLSAAKEHGILAPMYLELTTGLRRGELLALRWEDLDVQNRTLSMKRWQETQAALIDILKFQMSSRLSIGCRTDL